MAGRARVLIVDDNPDILVLLRTTLSSAGYETAEAANGRVALEEIERHRPDIVLLDIMMPVLDGWGVLEGLKGQPNRPPIVVVSALDSPVSADRAQGYGVAAYVTKPFSVASLVEMVEAVLSGGMLEAPQRQTGAAAS